MSIFNMIYEELKAKIEHLPEFDNRQAKRAWDALDREYITDIILDIDTFWFEYATYNSLTDQQHAWLTHYIEGKGYKYLYHTKQNRKVLA